VPGFVREMRVGGHGVNLDAHLLELIVIIGHIAQFGRADKSEIGGVEKEYRPLTLYIGFSHFDKLALLECLGLKRFDLSVDNGHR
jgi:hypothetical protein